MQAIRAGITSQAELDDLAHRWDEWMADADANMALDHYQIVAQKLRQAPSTQSLALVSVADRLSGHMSSLRHDEDMVTTDS